MEAEARNILREALMREEEANRLSRQITRLFADTGFVNDEGIPEFKGSMVKTVKFE